MKFSRIVCARVMSFSVDVIACESAGDAGVDRSDEDASSDEIVRSYLINKLFN